MSNEPPIMMTSHAQNPNVLKVARDLYATYCASSEGKNYQGLPCPAWDALTETVRGHWYTVARRVCDFADAAGRAGAAHGSDAVIGIALAEEPTASTIGHLRDPARALETWRTYATE